MSNSFDSRSSMDSLLNEQQYVMKPLRNPTVYSDKVYKIIVIGDSGVGKSSLLCRYADDSFTTNFIPTIGVDFKLKTVQHKGKRIKLQLWDTAGQERFRAITRAYYKNADGIMLIYDVGFQPSFYHIKDWLEDIQRYCPKRAVTIMVGNKIDMPRKVERAAAVEMAKALGIAEAESSARDATGVENAFHLMLDEIMAHGDVEGDLKDDRDSVDLDGRKPVTEAKTCPC